MSNKTLKKTLIKKACSVSIGGEDLGIVKDGSATFKIEAGEITELKEEGGRVVFTASGSPKRSLSFDIYKEELEELEETNLTGDLIFTIEGEKALTYKDATAVITREWTSAEGGIDHYECNLPSKAEAGAEA